MKLKKKNILAWEILLINEYAVIYFGTNEN